LTLVENSRSTKNWLIGIYYFLAERGWQFCADPVLAVWWAMLTVSIVESGYM